MLGALFGSGLMPINKKYALEAIAARFNEKVAAINFKAFAPGSDYVKKSLVTIS